MRFVANIMQGSAVVASQAFPTEQQAQDWVNDTIPKMRDGYNEDALADVEQSVDGAIFSGMAIPISGDTMNSIKPGYIMSSEQAFDKIVSAIKGEASLNYIGSADGGDGWLFNNGVADKPTGLWNGRMAVMEPVVYQNTKSMSASTAPSNNLSSSPYQDKILRDMAKFAGMGYGTLENDSGPLGKVLYAPPVTPDIGGPMGFIQESDV